MHRRYKLVVAATLTDDQRALVSSFASRKAALSARDFFRSNSFHADVIYDGPDDFHSPDLKPGESVNERRKTHPTDQASRHAGLGP